MLFCISTSNIQVLFDELCLDEKCKKKLSKTQVQRQKSTSEAVVSLIIHSISSVDVFTCGVCVCVCVCVQLTQLKDLHPLPALVLEYRQVCLYPLILTMF